MGPWQTGLAALLVGIGLQTPAKALEAGASVDEIERCVRENLNAESSVQSVEMIPRDRMGAERTIGAKIYWKRFEDGYSRVLARFTEPADIEGAGFLLIETGGSANMHLYMPELRKTRRITTQALRGSIYGTDFSYEDFERLQGFDHGEQPEREADAEVEGRAVFVLTAYPAPESGSAYEKIVSYIDQERCVPLRAELYEPPGRLRKLLRVDPSKVERSGESWVPTELVMQDLRDETETRLRLLDLKLGAELPDRTFRLESLERRRDP
jgi:outer membrane lipoprotein-sorting protein